MTSELLIFDCASNDLFHEQSKQNNDIDTTWLFNKSEMILQ